MPVLNIDISFLGDVRKRKESDFPEFIATNIGLSLESCGDGALVVEMLHFKSFRVLLERSHSWK